VRLFQDWQERKVFRALGVDAEAVQRAARSARQE
jgi:hypothetical protein